MRDRWLFRRVLAPSPIDPETVGARAQRPMEVSRQDSGHPPVDPERRVQHERVQRPARRAGRPWEAHDMARLEMTDRPPR
ncbi:MAG: hypothetical protein ACRDVW_02305 [Acidimicrobiales bacterium]